MVRAEFMRKFDRQAGQQIGELMERSGIRFIMPAVTVRYYKKKEWWVKVSEARWRDDGGVGHIWSATHVHSVLHDVFDIMHTLGSRRFHSPSRW